MKADKPIYGFKTEEFEERTLRAQRLMWQQEIDALLLTTEPEFRYFSGFHTLFWQSPARPWFLVIPLDGKPIAVIPEIGAERMASTWIDQIETWGSPRPNDEGLTELSDLAQLNEFSRSDVMPVDSEGIGAYLYCIPPEISVDLTVPSAGGGQYGIVLNGYVISSDQKLGKLSGVYRNHDEDELQVEGGTQGAAVLLMQFSDDLVS